MHSSTAQLTGAAVFLLLIAYFIVVTAVLPGQGVYADFFWEPIFVKYLLWNPNKGPGIITTTIIILIGTMLVIRFVFLVQISVEMEICDGARSTIRASSACATRPTLPTLICSRL